MKSDRLSFNIAIAKDTLRRCWPLWAAYLVYLIITLPVSILSYIRMNTWVEDITWLTGDLNSRVMTLGIHQAEAAIVIGMLTVMVLFGYLYNSRGNTLMNTLPVRRESMFLTLYLTGLIPLLMCQFLTMLMTALLTRGSGISMQSYLIWFACSAFGMLFFYGFSCFCAMLTGNLIVLPAVYAVLNLTAFALESCVNSCVSTLVYGMPDGKGPWLAFLSPIVYIDHKVMTLVNPDYTVSFKGLPVLAAYALAGLFFAVIAMLLYRKRRMESVSDLVAIQVLKPIFRICMAVGTAFVCGAFLFSSFFNTIVFGASAAWLMGVLLVLGAALGWIAAEMLIRRSVRIFPMPWKGLAAVCACCILTVVIAEADLTGYEKRIPDLQKVENVSLGMDVSTFRDPENIAAMEALHQELIDKKDIYDGGNAEFMKAANRRLTGPVPISTKEIGMDAYAKEIFQYYIPLTYHLTDGTTLDRYYTVRFYPDDVDNPDTTIGRLVTLLNTREGIESRMFGGEIPLEEKNINYAEIDVETASGGWTQKRLTQRELVDLWESAMVPDAEDGNLCLLTIADTENNLKTQTNMRIEVSLQDFQNSQEQRYWYHSFRVFTFSDRCLDWIRENTDLEWTTMAAVREEQNLLEAQYAAVG
jgi:ABC-2 type transport system permease protein